MSTRSAPRMQFARPNGAALCVEIVTPEGSAAPWLELVKRGAAGETIGFVAVRKDELDRLIAGLTECRNVLNGHPKHQAKAVG